MRLDLRERKEEERKKRGKISLLTCYILPIQSHTFPSDVGLTKQYRHVSSLNIALKKLIGNFSSGELGHDALLQERS